MKLKQIKTNKSKLIRLQLLKSKTYKSNSNNIEHVNLESTELHLKKAFQIIYNYHFNNKTIFFVGIPQNVQKKYIKTLQKTQHLFIPESTWINGILSNRTPILKYIHRQMCLNVKTKKNNTNLKSFFEIQQKPDLMVIFNKDLEFNALQEADKLRIPMIAITTDLNINSIITYKIPGNFNFLNKKLDNVFFLLLNSIFKKLN